MRGAAPRAAGCVCGWAGGLDCCVLGQPRGRAGLCGALLWAAVWRPQWLQRPAGQMWGPEARHALGHTGTPRGPGSSRQPSIHTVRSPGSRSGTSGVAGLGGAAPALAAATRRGPGRQRAPRAGQARALCANAGGPRPHPRRAGYYVGLGCAGAGAEAGRRWEGAPMCRPRLRWLAGLARGGGSPPSWWRRCCPILRPAGVGTGLAVPARACPRAPGGPWPRPQSPPAQLIALRASHWSLPRIPVPLWDLHRCQVRPCRRPCLLPLCAPSATSVHRPSAASSCG